jgi:hypothetical protein
LPELFAVDASPLERVSIRVCSIDEVQSQVLVSSSRNRPEEN